ncbi:hypothetical protein LMTR3_22645 [Bradyrhizobium sp. LMTR 3]|nr:hypothetical protein LMTR3_22645 [Bradyrhizobium sp. LMTR 3]
MLNPSGGYGHSRLKETVLGAVTRAMLQSMTVPTLMSHSPSINGCVRYQREREREREISHTSIMDAANNMLRCHISSLR